MKTLLLSACLVAAATVSAAELKSPDEVAREWNQAMATAPVVKAPAPGLRNLAMPTPPPFAVMAPALPPVAPVDNLFSPSVKHPPQIDPDHPMPRGAKPYDFSGQLYWLVPLAATPDV